MWLCPVQKLNKPIPLLCCKQHQIDEVALVCACADAAKPGCNRIPFPLDYQKFKFSAKCLECGEKLLVGIHIWGEYPIGTEFGYWCEKDWDNGSFIAIDGRTFPKELVDQAKDELKNRF